jgi:hypothetical protein
MRVVLLAASADALAQELARALGEEGVECALLALRTPSLENLLCPSSESQALVVEGSKDKAKSFSALLSRASELAVAGESLVHAFGLWPFGGLREPPEVPFLRPLPAERGERAELVR